MSPIGCLHSPTRMLEGCLSYTQLVEFAMPASPCHLPLKSRSTRFGLRLATISALSLLTISCSDVVPIPFTSIEGNWAPLGATCDETALYFQFHEGLAQRLARYEPASELLFFYHDVKYIAPAEGESKGMVSLAVSKNTDGKDNAASETWSFTYHMNGRLSLAAIDGKQIDKTVQTELSKTYSLEKCSKDQLYQIEGQETKEQGKETADNASSEAANVPVSE